MLQNARVTAFTVSELLPEKQHRGWGEGVKLPPIQNRVEWIWPVSSSLYAEWSFEFEINNLIVFYLILQFNLIKQNFDKLWIEMSIIKIFPRCIIYYLAALLKVTLFHGFFSGF